MNTQIQQFANPSRPATGVSLSTPTFLSTLEETNVTKETAKEDLHATWKFGEGWRLDFGRKLNMYRPLFEHGEWIDFLEADFGLHRMTANRWMRLAAEADGVDLDAPQTHVDEPDNHRETVNSLIDDAREKVEEALVLNGPKPYRVVIDGVTEDEKDQFKLELKSDRSWVQGILRRAWTEVLAGKPMVTDGKLDQLPEDPFFDNEQELADVTA